MVEQAATLASVEQATSALHKDTQLKQSTLHEADLAFRQRAEAQLREFRDQVNCFCRSECFSKMCLFVYF
jgi:hypothetical protein